jgi:hypothetical protein
MLSELEKIFHQGTKAERQEVSLHQDHDAEKDTAYDQEAESLISPVVEHTPHTISKYWHCVQ